MMHPQVEPDHQVLLLQTLPVKEGVKVHRRVVYVLAVIRVGTLGLSVLAFGDLEVIFCPMCCVDQVTAIQYGQVCEARIR
jgi:hypothetical protein